MSSIHKELANGKWKNFSFFDQMGNIWSEIGRCANWNKKRDKKMGQQAFEMGLELLDLTIEDPKNKNKLLELCLLREMLADHFYFSNEYNSTDEQWDAYFYPFAYAAAISREKTPNTQPEEVV